MEVLAKNPPGLNGSVLYAEIATGTVTCAGGTDYKTTQVVAAGLAGPVQMTLGRGALYVTEATGKLTRIDLAGGARRTADKNNALYRVRWQH